MDKQFENESKMCRRGFPVSRNVYMRTRVKFMCVNKICVQVKVERGSTFTFTRDPPYIASNFHLHE